MKRLIIAAVAMAAFCFTTSVNAQTPQKTTPVKTQCDKKKMTSDSKLKVNCKEDAKCQNVGKCKNGGCCKNDGKCKKDIKCKNVKADCKVKNEKFTGNAKIKKADCCKDVKK